MFTRRSSRKRGFTLVETIVSVGIVAALAAVVYPTVVEQFDSADPAKTTEDLGNIKTAIEIFGINVRPHQPQDVEDLVNAPDALNVGEDITALGAAYTVLDSANWRGPYLGLSIPTGSSASLVVLTTGFGGEIENKLPLFDVDVTPATTGGAITVTNAAADFLAVKINGLSGPAFNAINELIDGPTETTATSRRLTGRFRCAEAVTTDAAACASGAIFLAAAVNQ